MPIPEYWEGRGEGNYAFSQPMTYAEVATMATRQNVWYLIERPSARDGEAWFEPFVELFENRTGVEIENPSMPASLEFVQHVMPWYVHLMLRVGFVSPLEETLFREITPPTETATGTFTVASERDESVVAGVQRMDVFNSLRHGREAALLTLVVVIAILGFLFPRINLIILGVGLMVMMTMEISMEQRWLVLIYQLFMITPILFAIKRGVNLSRKLTHSFSLLAVGYVSAMVVVFGLMGGMNLFDSFDMNSIMVLAMIAAGLLLNAVNVQFVIEYNAPKPVSFKETE